MATINAPSLQDTVYSGDCPLANAHGYVTLASAQIGDKVRLNKVYAGTKIYDVKFVNAALGASTTVSIGYEYVNGEAGGSATALMAAAATSSAGTSRQSGNIPPVTMDYDAYIIATIAGGAATGKLDVVTSYEFKGK
jgi:hypothetical protein